MTSEQIIQLISDKALIAIDGRCAAGKTTLAAQIQKQCSCNVIHMDSFFLRPFQRTQSRLSEPGGNIDRERFLNEVLIPLCSGCEFSYRPFDCKTQSLATSVTVIPKKLTIIEGSYSCHPAFFDYYDFTLFLDVDRTEQLNRIHKRNADSFNLFQSKWIPLEERYFSALQIQKRCDISLVLQ